MMYIDNEVLEKMIMTIVEGFDRIEKKLDRMGRVKDCLNGDELLDNYDIAKLLNVCKRLCDSTFQKLKKRINDDKYHR